MQKLLVHGVDGVIGSNLALALTEHFRVLGLYAKEAIELAGLETARHESGDHAQLKLLVKDFGPDWILHCGPLAASAWDLAAHRVLADGEAHAVKLLAELSQAAGSRLSVITTDAVFAGPRMFHEENSPTTASGAAAMHARNVEGMLQSTDALVVRTHAYGFGPTVERTSFAEHIWNVLATGGVLDLDGVRHATPILATDLAPMLLHAYERRFQGLYHITGAERTSPIRFAAELAAVGGFDAPRIRPRGSLSIADIADETSLNCRRARRSLETPMPLLRDGLARFAVQARDGWRQRVTGSQASHLCATAA